MHPGRPHATLGDWEDWEKFKAQEKRLLSKKVNPECQRR
jgi:hypothetical protein